MTPRVMFVRELQDLKNAVTEMSSRAEICYQNLIQAASDNDTYALEQLLAFDREMINMQRNIEAKCLQIMTKQQPIAGDLRVVSAALKVVTDIERIGDHVTDMAELFLRLEPPYREQSDILLKEMMEEALEMVRRAVNAFCSGDIELAKTVMEKDDVVDDYFNRIKDMLIESIKSGAFCADRIVDLLMLAKYVEKIADHAVNIGEWTMFQKTGSIQDRQLL